MGGGDTAGAARRQGRASSEASGEPPGESGDRLRRRGIGPEWGQAPISRLALDLANSCLSPFRARREVVGEVVAGENGDAKMVTVTTFHRRKW
jgi:hypothetical protein